MGNVVKLKSSINKKHEPIMRKPFPPENSEYNSLNVESVFYVDICIDYDEVNSFLVVSSDKVTEQDIMKNVLNYFVRGDELDRVHRIKNSEPVGLWYRNRKNGKMYGIVGITEVEDIDVDTMLKYCSAVPFEGLVIDQCEVDIE